MRVGSTNNISSRAKCSGEEEDILLLATVSVASKGFTVDRDYPFVFVYVIEKVMEFGK